MMYQKKRVFGIVMLVLALVVAGCGDSGDSAEGDTTTSSLSSDGSSTTEAAPPSTDAPATTMASYFEGQTIDIVVGYDPGSSQDIEARLIGDFLTEKVPGNPQVEISNQPGGAGLAAYEFVRNAPPDGLTLVLSGSSAPVDQLLRPYIGEEEGASLGFDINELVWVGGTGPVSNAVWTNGQSGVTDIDDLVALTDPIIAGATRPGSSTYMFMALLREATGAPIDIVTGYSTGSDLSLALLRNEIQLQGGNWSTYVGNVEGLGEAEELIPLVAYVNLPPDEDIEELGVEPIPNIRDLTDDAQTQTLIDAALASQSWGRLIGAPPGTPVEVVQPLRDAIAELAEDPDFIAERDAQGIGQLEPLPGDVVETMITEYLATPEEVIERLVALLEGE